MATYYLWQPETYGGAPDPGRPAEIYRYRPMPCTPPGDCLGSVDTAARAALYLVEIGPMDPERAREWLAGRDGFRPAEQRIPSDSTPPSDDA